MPREIIPVERHKTEDPTIEKVQDAYEATVRRVTDRLPTSNATALHTVVGGFTTDSSGNVVNVHGTGVRVTKVANATGLYRVSLDVQFSDADVFAIGKQSLVQPQTKAPTQGFFDLQAFTYKVTDQGPPVVVGAAAFNPSNAVIDFVVVGQRR